MPKRKSQYPYRKGYKVELQYPRRATILPTHGSGPRCRVDFNPGDDGPWSMLQIMRVAEDNEVEEFTCAMPRYYAVPLILMNKRLAFFEASCQPDGMPLLPPPPTTKKGEDGGSGGGGGLKDRDLREYAYLWQLRTRFLQAVFDMNHERRLDERWRHAGIHGFVHRLYGRYGHEETQRILYWRDEIKARRVPYTTPDIADMDWASHIAFGTHINGFLWNKVSQGYPRVVKDEPPQEAWRAWRRAASRGLKPAALYRTPACSPARDPPSVGPSGHGSGPEPTQTQSQSQSQTRPPCGPRGGAEEEVVGPSSATTARAAGSGTSGNAAIGCCAGINGDGDGEDGDTDMDYEDVLTEALTPDSHTHEWTLPFLTSGQESEAAGTSSVGRLRSSEILLKFNAQEEMKLAVIRCVFAHVEDVGEDFRTQLKVAYAPRVS